MRFLGTGAAETMPNPFCDCPVCTGVRRDGARYFKRRSAFQVSDTLMIDFGPDVIDAAHQYGVSFCSLRSILFTHSHDDHLSFPNLSLIGMSQHIFPEPIQLYLSPEAFGWVCENIGSSNPDFDFSLCQDGTALLRFGNGNGFRFRPLPCGTWVTIDEYQVKALRSSHPAWGKGERAWNYLIRLPDGRKLFYACDTGRVLPETLEELAGEQVDLLIMECTFGSRRLEKTSGHLDVYSFLDTMEQFRDRQVIRPDTQVYSTHLNHKHTFTPLMLQRYFAKHLPAALQKLRGRRGAYGHVRLPRK